MATGTIRYWAAAKAAAGVDEETADASTLAEALAVALARTADRPRLAEVLKRCSFVVDGHPTGRRPHDEVMLAEGWVVEALPPFAGG
jgi:molybdopterin synthase sulfur carrier subunit